MKINSKHALISVSDKTNLEDFANFLISKDYKLLTTSGTAKFLAEKGIESIKMSEFTNQKEILGGRVKTLHPKIYAGILARRHLEEDLNELKELDFPLIDLVVTNLYPFLKNIEAKKTPKEMAELIDIGGPCMLRAAAKNFADVLTIISPDDYEVAKKIIASELSEGSDEESLNFRKSLSVKVFSALANYNLQIAKYFDSLELDADLAIKDQKTSGLNVEGYVLEKAQDLRYGENPHQKASFYKPITGAYKDFTQHQGKELSYNNFLDFDAALKIVRAMPKDKPGAIIVKHLNPCGAASANTLVEALRLAKTSDPRSHFGGIIALNKIVDAETAREIVKDFCELVLAESYEPEALQILSKKKNLRVLELDIVSRLSTELRSVEFGYLVQELDRGVSAVEEAKLMTTHNVSDASLNDLQIAWSLCSAVKSNAITLVKNSKLLAAGAGQMSRIDSLDVAFMKAKGHGHDTKGAVAASDAFFPFSDCVEKMKEEGVVAVIVPKGSIKDPDVVSKAKEIGLALYFAEDRHFRH